MGERVPAGTWVEIGRVVLQPGERAPQVPEDTARVPLELRVRGFLTEPAVLGGNTEIVTLADRRHKGLLLAVNPPYDHTFGVPIPELAFIGAEVRALLRKKGGGR